MCTDNRATQLCFFYVPHGGVSLFSVNTSSPLRSSTCEPSLMLQVVGGANTTGRGGLSVRAIPQYSGWLRVQSSAEALWSGRFLSGVSIR